MSIHVVGLEEEIEVPGWNPGVKYVHTGQETNPQPPEVQSYPFSCSNIALFLHLLRFKIRSNDDDYDFIFPFYFVSIQNFLFVKEKKGKDYAWCYQTALYMEYWWNRINTESFSCSFQSCPIYFSTSAPSQPLDHRTILVISWPLLITLMEKLHWKTSYSGVMASIVDKSYMQKV